MKKSIIIAIIIFLSAKNYVFAQNYDMNVPLEGESIANNALQMMVLKDIYPIITRLNPLCTEHRISNTQIIHYPYDVEKKDNKYVKGYWKELWTVEYCGNKIQIPVTFNIHKKKTDYIIEKDLILK